MLQAKLQVDEVQGTGLVEHQVKEVNVEEVQVIGHQVVEHQVVEVHEEVHVVRSPITKR